MEKQVSWRKSLGQGKNCYHNFPFLHISYCSKNDLFEVAKADILDEIAGLAYHKKIEPAEWSVVCFIKNTNKVVCSSTKYCKTQCVIFPIGSHC